MIERLDAEMRRSPRDKARPGTVIAAAAVAAFWAQTIGYAQAQTQPPGQAAARPGEESPSSLAATPFAEVIVTARKRTEPLQSVPIAIDVYDRQALDRLNVSTLQDLQTVAPSLYVQPSTFRQDTINIAIRGQQNFQSTDLSFDTAVAVYVDGVYYARPVGLTGALFDVDKVQVLDGPQGTLVGRNSTGGAILYQTREPTPDLGGHIDLTGGDYDHDEAQVVFNTPLTKTLWLRAAFNQTQTQGYIKNDFYDPMTGERNTTPGEGDRKFGGVISLRWQPDDSFHITLRGAFDTEHDTGPTYHDLGYFVGTTPASGGKPSICNIPATCTGFTDLQGQVITPYFANYLTGATPSALPSAYNALLNSVAREQTEGFWSTEQAVSNDDVGHYRTVSGAAEKQLGDLQIRLTGAYRGFDTSGDSVSRGLPYATTIYLYRTPDYGSWQSELTLNGSSFADRLKWTAGLFFFRESSPDDGDQLYLFLPSGIAPAAASGKQITYTDPTRNSQQNTSYAGYAQATYSLTPRTRLTLGGRYTEDVRQAQLSTTTLRFPASPATTRNVVNGVYTPADYVLEGVAYAGQTQACGLTDAAGVLLPLSSCAASLEKTYRKPTWTLSVEHDLFAHTLVYATARSGYRSGGVNAASISPGTYLAKPEDIQDYEIGLKSDWSLWGAPVRSDIDAYYSDYTNIQIETELPNVTLAATSSGGPCTQAVFNAGQCLGASNDDVTLNARSAHIKGFEWRVDVKPAPGLTLGASGSYLDAVYTNYSFTPPPGYLLPVGTTDFSGTHFPLPAWQIDNTVDYVLPVRAVGPMSLGQASVLWRTYWQSRNEASLSGYNASQAMRSYALSDAQLYLSDLDRTRTSVRAYVTNVFNAKVCIPEAQGVLNSAPNATFGTAGTSGVLQCVPMAPRMYGVRLSYTF